MPPGPHEVAPERPQAFSGFVAKGLAIQPARRLDPVHIATTQSYPGSPNRCGAVGRTHAHTAPHYDATDDLANRAGLPGVGLV